MGGYEEEGGGREEEKGYLADDKISGFLLTIREGGGEAHPTNTYRKSRPNRQRTLNKIVTKLRCRNFVHKHRLSIQIGAKTCKNAHAVCTYSN